MRTLSMSAFGAFLATLFLISCGVKGPARAGSLSRGIQFPAKAFSLIRAMPAPKEGYRLLVIDPARNEVWASLDVGLPPGSFPVSSTILGDRAFVSVTGPRDGRSLVLSIDLSGNERKRLELAGRNPGIITALPASGKLALCDNSLDMRGQGSLWIIDPLSLSIENELSIPGGAGYLREAEEDSVFLTVGYYFGEPRLSKLDIKTLSLRQIAGSPSYSGSDEAWGALDRTPDGCLVLCDGEDPSLVKVDARSGAEMARIRFDYAATDIPENHRLPVWIAADGRSGLVFAGHGITFGSLGIRGWVSVHRASDLSFLSWIPRVSQEFRLIDGKLYFIDSNDILVHEASGDFGRIATIPLG